MIIALILVLLLALAYGALQGLLGHGPFRFLNTMYLKGLPGNAEIYRPENVAPVENSPLSGMNLCFLGSSVTEGAASLETSFAEYIAVRNNCTYVKEAVGGTTLADNDKTSVCYGIHRRVRPEPRLPGYKPLVFPCGMYSAFPELRRKPLKSYRISCFRVVAARGACYNNGENQPNSVKKSASKPMTDHGRHALWFPLG